MKELPPLEKLRELLDYCPVTGQLTWRVHRNSQALKGQEAGSISKRYGYRILGFDDQVYMAHRIAWFLYYGAAPTKQLDHINHDRSDNRIINLREVVHIENTRNRKQSVRNSSGHTGVYPNGSGKWIARIAVNYQKINLGTYPSIDEAVAARKAAEGKYKFHPNHGL